MENGKTKLSEILKNADEADRQIALNAKNSFQNIDSDLSSLENAISEEMGKGVVTSSLKATSKGGDLIVEQIKKCDNRDFVFSEIISRYVELHKIIQDNYSNLLILSKANAATKSALLDGVEYNKPEVVIPSVIKDDSNLTIPKA